MQASIQPQLAARREASVWLLVLSLLSVSLSLSLTVSDLSIWLPVSVMYVYIPHIIDYSSYHYRSLFCFISLSLSVYVCIYMCATCVSVYKFTCIITSVCLTVCMHESVSVLGSS